MSSSRNFVDLPFKEEESFDHKFKILMIGDAGSGKTSIARCFALNEFDTSYMATIGIDYLEKVVTSASGLKVKLQIWDTAGQERFRTLIRPYYRGTTGIILVYDVTDESTFENIKRWMVTIEEYVQQHQSVRKVIIGNKIDLKSGRAVSFERGSQLAGSFDVPFFEVSAKTNENIGQLFEKFTEEILKTNIQPLNCHPKPTTEKIILTQEPRTKDKKKKCCSLS